MYKRQKLYYSTPFNHLDGQDGPQDASHDPAAACIYAFECVLNSDSKYVDLIFNRSIEYAIYDITLNDQNFGSEFEPPVAQEFLELIHPSYRKVVDWHEELIRTGLLNGARLCINHELWLRTDY